MFPGFSSESNPAQRWGIVFIALWIGLEMLLRRGAEVKSFILQALSVLIASVLGPLIVEAVAHYKEQEWDGLQLGLITLGACTVVAVILALVFRAFQ